MESTATLRPVLTAETMSSYKPASIQSKQRQFVIKRDTGGELKIVEKITKTGMHMKNDRTGDFCSRSTPTNIRPI